MMRNWISNLGGYEAAKTELERLKSSKDNSSIVDAMIPTLEYFLLKYRRANNIFEVGDWFTSDVVLKPYKIIQHENNFLKLWCKETTVEFSDCDLILRAFINAKHATDAEIKAGHRL